MQITLPPEAEARIQQLLGLHGHSPSEVVTQALELLIDYQAWENEQDLLDLEVARQSIAAEGTVSWDTIQAELGL
ncbi:MAG: elongation factor 1 delta (guanine nucleotide exchange protein) [Prochlorothrix sp.]